MAMSKDTISWVHLSDIHLTSKKNAQTQRDILKALQASLKDLEPPDLLLLTGDIVRGNLPDDPIKDQFKVATDFLGRIVDDWRLDPTRIFIVPGNHDVNRERVSPGEKSYAEFILTLRKEEREKALRDLWVGTSESQKQQRSDIARRLEDYVTFLKDLKCTHLLTDDDKLFFYANTININSISIGIAGFNTAWSSSQDKEQGRLLFGMEQVFKAEEKLDKAQLRIALAHHPPHWINDTEGHLFRRQLEQGYHFFLHGHEHYLGLSKEMLSNKNFRIGAGAIMQDEGEIMCFYHMTLPIITGSAQMPMYYRVPTAEGCDFMPGKKMLSVSDLSVSRLINNDEEPDPPNVVSHVPDPAPAYRPIKYQSHQEFVEFKFSELLRPILRELKSLLEVPELALVFLPQRDGTIVPALAPKEYDNYQKVRDSLLKESEKFRKHKLSSAVVSNASDSILFCDDQTTTPLLVNSGVILERALTRWNEWVNTPLANQIRQWIARPDTEIVCSLKYIPSPDNRDVVGYIIVPQQLSAARKQPVNQSAGENVQRLIEERLLPILRHLVLELTEIKVRELDSRIMILDTILEAAVSLSGADWGCIKSSTLGAASLDTQQEKCELVQAVCVHNCPRFFQEGRLVDTEELVAKAVKENNDKVLDLGSETRKSFRHPAAQMAVFLIRDPEEIIEPQLPNSHVVGTIVVQHTAPAYLKDFYHVYSPFLREIADLTSRTTVAAASKSLVSILTSGITGELTESFIHKVEGVVNRVASDGDVTWVLLQPDGHKFRVYKSTNDLDGLQQVLLEVIGADKPVHDQTRLAAFVCNSTMSFRLQMLHRKSQDTQMGRIGITEFGADAHFEDSFEDAVEGYKQGKENQVVFNLGRREAWWGTDKEGLIPRRVSLAIGPVVSPTGGPVGVLAVLREVENYKKPWDLKTLKEFEKNLALLRDDLYVSHLALKRNGGAGITKPEGQ
jgi:predicted MPP superfamily phosphohydrolase